MAKYLFDLSSYRDRASARVPEGTYVLQVAWVEQGQTSDKTKTMITVGCTIVGGEFNGSPIVDRLVQSPQSLFRTVNFLNALGIPTPRQQFSIDLDKLAGRKFVADLRDGEPYRGVISSEIGAYSRLPKADPSEATDLEEYEAVATPAAAEAEIVPTAPAPVAAESVAEPVAAVAVNGAEVEQLDLDSIL